MTGPLRLGIAGCGRIVERGYLPALWQQGEASEGAGWALAAVADPDLARASRVAAVAGASAYGTAAEMIAGAELHAIVVATPAGLHAETAAQAAAAGLPSLVEKPPAADLEGAMALAALEPAPALGFNRRFLQGARLRPLVPHAGWLELDLEMRFRQDRWGAHSARDEALLDAGIHLIDLATFLAGAEPIAVRDAVVAPTRASLELELGRGRARIRCATDRAYAERVEVRDRAGRLLGASRTARLSARWQRLRGGGDPLVDSLRRQLDRFAARVRGEGAGELADAGAGIAAMTIVEAARRSAELDGAEVTVTALSPAAGST